MSLLNVTYTKKEILLRCENLRPRFTRVSQELLDWLEDELRLNIDGVIRSAPSIGRTLYPAIRPKKEPE